MLTSVVGFTACSGKKTQDAEVSESSGAVVGGYSSDGNDDSEVNDSRDNKINGHEYVDLGLSVKWATYNLAGFYAWGEILPKTEYTEENSITLDQKMEDIAGDARYDVARAKWGGSWRLPMKAELLELRDCDWTWTTMNGKNGYRVTGPNGNSIFLPVAGYRDGSSLCGAGSCGGYWSSTPTESDNDFAYNLDFSSGSHYVGWSYRYYGRSVRPVSE